MPQDRAGRHYGTVAVQGIMTVEFVKNATYAVASGHAFALFDEKQGI